MVRTKKKNSDPVSDIVETISYGTGLICAKVSKLGKVAKTKEWKNVVSSTQDLVKNAGMSIKGSITELQESFDEGVKSIVEEDKEIPAPKLRTKKNEEDDDIHDVEVIKKKDTKEEGNEIIEEEVEVIVDQVEIKEAEIKDEKVVIEEIKEVKLKKEIVEDLKAQEQQDTAIENKEEIAPLPNELEGADIGEINEDLMDDEDTPKEKKTPPKSKKKVAKISIESEGIESNPSLFTIAEFKKDGKDPKGLMGSIRKNKPEISLSSTDPLDWLNELLSNGDLGQPLKYDIQETPEIGEARVAFESASGDEKTQKLILLNRLILEQAYPLKCPKIQIEETKAKARRSKSTDSGLNLN